MQSFYRVKLLLSPNEAWCWWKGGWSPCHSFPTCPFSSSFILLMPVSDAFWVGAQESKMRSEKESYSLTTGVPKCYQSTLLFTGYLRGLCVDLLEHHLLSSLLFWTTGIHFYSSLSQPWGSCLYLQFLSAGICFVFTSSRSCRQELCKVHTGSPSHMARSGLS